MKFTKSVVASALVALVQAQTPGNFSVVSTAPLNVIGQPGNVNILPGSLLPQSGKSWLSFNSGCGHKLTKSKMSSMSHQSPHLQMRQVVSMWHS